jgi:DNA mismatch repair ATPase MutS
MNVLIGTAIAAAIGLLVFFLDEIYRGTNSVERQAASVEVLKYLANRKDFVLVSTHDLALTQLLAKTYTNYHFQEEIQDEGLSFDYKLHPGPSTSRNAIALLRYVGYPESIVENALERIAEDKNGALPAAAGKS